MKIIILISILILIGCQSKNNSNENTSQIRNDQSITLKDTLKYYNSTYIGFFTLENPIEDTLIQFPLTGKYVIEKYVSINGLITSMSSEAAESFVGKTVEYKPNYIIFDNVQFKFNTMEVDRFTDEEYQRWTHGSESSSVEFSDLEYFGNKQFLISYKLQLESDQRTFGMFVEYFDDENIIVYEEGFYFKLKK